jgi:hypothetical protein
MPLCRLSFPRQPFCLQSFLLLNHAVTNPTYPNATTPEPDVSKLFTTVIQEKYYGFVMYRLHSKLVCLVVQASMFVRARRQLIMKFVNIL